MKFDEITRSSIKESGKILLAILPLFALWFITYGEPSLTRLKAGIYISAAMLVAMAALRFSHGILLYAMAIIFAVSIIFGVLLKNIWVLGHFGVIVNGILTAVVLLTMTVGRPFVLDYASRGVAREVRESYSFIRGVYMVTSYWVVILLTGTLISQVQLNYPGPGSLSYLILKLAVLLIGVAGTAVYNIHFKRGRVAKERESPEAQRKSAKAA